MCNLSMYNIILLELLRSLLIKTMFLVDQSNIFIRSSKLRLNCRFSLFIWKLMNNGTFNLTQLNAVPKLRKPIF